jgi:hypothetical protein
MVESEMLLSTLPADIWQIISSKMVDDDISRLWMTGSRALNRTLGEKGGVVSFVVTLRRDYFPTIVYFLTHLRELRIYAHAKVSQLSLKGLYREMLPSSLKVLFLDFPGSCTTLIDSDTIDLYSHLPQIEELGMTSGFWTAPTLQWLGPYSSTLLYLTLPDGFVMRYSSLRLLPKSLLYLKMHLDPAEDEIDGQEIMSGLAELHVTSPNIISWHWLSPSSLRTLHLICCGEPWSQLIEREVTGKFFPPFLTDLSIQASSHFLSLQWQTVVSMACFHSLRSLCLPQLDDSRGILPGETILSELPRSLTSMNISNLSITIPVQHCEKVGLGSHPILKSWQGLYLETELDRSKPSRKGIPGYPTPTREELQRFYYGNLETIKFVSMPENHFFQLLPLHVTALHITNPSARTQLPHLLNLKHLVNLKLLELPTISMVSTLNPKEKSENPIDWLPASLTDLRIGFNRHPESDRYLKLLPPNLLRLKLVKPVITAEEWLLFPPSLQCLTIRCVSLQDPALLIRSIPPRLQELDLRVLDDGVLDCAVLYGEVLLSSLPRTLQCLHLIPPSPPTYSADTLLSLPRSLLELSMPLSDTITKLDPSSLRSLCLQLPRMCSWPQLRVLIP